MELSISVAEGSDLARIAVRALAKDSCNQSFDLFPGNSEAEVKKGGCK